MSHSGSAIRHLRDAYNSRSRAFFDQFVDGTLLGGRPHVENGACTSPEFIAECVYVLGGTVYGFDRTDVANTMIALLDDIACEHESTMRYALELYRNHSLDFADCILAARFVVEGTPVLDRKSVV